MRMGDFHKKRAAKFNSNTDWAKFKKTRNKLNTVMYKAKKTTFFSKKVKDCAQAKDPKQSWKWINELLGKNNRGNK